MRLLALFIFGVAALGPASSGYGEGWTAEAAKEEVFRNVRWKIDAARYPAQDPHFHENQQVVQAHGSGFVRDRFVSANPAGAGRPGYVVSRLQPNGLPETSMEYRSDGRALSVRLFSAPDYPRAAYIYCLSSDCPVKGEQGPGRPGDLVSLSFHPSAKEVFYFDVRGQLTFHGKD